jgi:hypothetical protein
MVEGVFDARGRPIKLGSSDRQRWKVERGFGWMDHCRRLVVRDERAVEPYHAFCHHPLVCQPDFEIAWLC